MVLTAYHAPQHYRTDNFLSTVDTLERAAAAEEERDLELDTNLMAAYANCGAVDKAMKVSHTPTSVIVGTLSRSLVIICRTL